MVNLHLGGVQQIGGVGIGGSRCNDEENSTVEELPLTSDTHDLPNMCQCQSLFKSPQFLAMCTPQCAHYIMYGGTPEPVTQPTLAIHMLE